MLKTTILTLGVTLFGSLAFADPTPTPPTPTSKIKVVATIPDIADVVNEIGGDHVDVKAITHGKENLHAVMARPSDLIAISRAQLFVQVGLSLETAFVPGLLEGARNQAIMPGKPGFVNCSEAWTPIEVPTSLSRRAGDVHPQGNPHMNLDPRAGGIMANAIHDGLVRIDPGSKAVYDENLKVYLDKFEKAKKRWDSMTDALKGKQFAVYHLEFDYLARYHGMEIVDSIETKPGIPPTPNHLAEVIADMKTRNVKVILIAPWSDNGDVKRVAEATGAKIVIVPNQAGTSKGTKTWIGMMDHLHDKLAEAFDVPQPQHTTGG